MFAYAVIGAVHLAATSLIYLDEESQELAFYQSQSIRFDRARSSNNVERFDHIKFLPVHLRDLAWKTITSAGSP